MSDDSVKNVCGTERSGTTRILALCFVVYKIADNVFVISGRGR